MSDVKAALFLVGVVWSIWLGERILVSGDVLRAKRWLPSLPGLAGIVATGIVWWPAIFGISFIRYRNGNERGIKLCKANRQAPYARAAAPIIGSICLAERTNSFETGYLSIYPAVAQSLLRPDSHRPLTPLGRRATRDCNGRLIARSTSRTPEFCTGECFFAPGRFQEAATLQPSNGFLIRMRKQTRSLTRRKHLANFLAPLPLHVIITVRYDKFGEVRDLGAGDAKAIT